MFTSSFYSVVVSQGYWVTEIHDVNDKITYFDFSITGCIRGSRLIYFLNHCCINSLFEFILILHEREKDIIKVDPFHWSFSVCILCIYFELFSLFYLDLFSVDFFYLRVKYVSTLFRAFFFLFYLDLLSVDLFFYLRVVLSFKGFCWSFTNLFVNECPNFWTLL